MNEETYRRWDVVAKFVAPILTVTGILVGVWQFSTEQAAQLQRQREQIATNNKLDFKRRVWEKQLEVYSKISNVTGRIASSRNKSDKAKFTKDIDEFYNLYWGDLIYVKDAIVEGPIYDFHLAVQDFQKGYIEEKELKFRADQVNNALRKSSKESWSAE